VGLLSLAPVLAHQGGWDEMLFVLVPIALFATLLWRASKRADRLVSERHRAPGAPSGDDDAAGPAGEPASEPDGPPGPDAQPPVDEAT